MRLQRKSVKKSSRHLRGELQLIFSIILMMVSMPSFSDRDTSRDQFRNPTQTLAFFGLRPEMDVVEISPGGGWYTEVLADFIEGDLMTAHYDPNSERSYYRRSFKRFEKKISSNSELYSNVKMYVFDAGKNLLTVPNSSADALVTFRNVHNWLRSNTEGSSFGLFFQALKPGGVLGVVEHRAPPGTDRDTMLASGYMPQDYVIQLALDAGFIFEASSEINANKKDTANHPKGVWTLPPSLSLGEKDREKYLAIGESDRMTLRFRKPVN